MSKLTAGQVTIHLGDEEFTLSCTPRAGIAVSEKFGGFREVLRRLQDFDVGVATSLIALGAGIKGTEAVKALQEKVYSAGLVKLTPDLTRFTMMLANGGRDPEAEGEEGDGGKDAA